MTKDFDIILDLFNGQASIRHVVSERFADDISEAVAELIEEHSEAEEELADMYEMGRHIEKLEAMLDRRKVRYKKWEERHL